MRRLGPITAAIAALVLFLPTVAEALVEVQVPPTRMCLGTRMTLGAQFHSPGGRRFRVDVTDTTGRLVWRRSGVADGKWRLWRFVPGRLGTFRTTYRIAGPDRSFRTKVVACGEGLTLTDDDYGTAMLSLSQARPGSADVGCELVTYAGREQATVRLYGVTRGTGLDRFLRLTVTRGTLAGSPATCAGFTPDSRNYLKKGPGVIYRGTLRKFPDSYDKAVADPAGTVPVRWANGESHAYRFTVRLKGGNGAQGLVASQRFIWEARTT